MNLQELKFEVSERAGQVTALLLEPPVSEFVIVLGHGAGAGMRHPFMERISQELAELGMATFRYQFPYTERGQRRPNSRPTLLATVRKAVECALELAGERTLLAGGKSMGGRMTSLAASESKLPAVRGLVFFGFPLHAAGKPSSERGQHLEAVDLPMLFLQGTRDKLAELEHLGPVCESLGERATLKVIEGADHSFHVLKRSGRSDDEVLKELANSAHDWALRFGTQKDVPERLPDTN